MSPTITLTVTNGSLKGKEYVLGDRSAWTIGRSRDCDVVLLGGEEFCLVSRHHCLIETDPPAVLDLGSMNGTFVNGTVIGMRAKGERPGDLQGPPWPPYELQEGDEVQVGTTVFRMGIEVAPEDLTEALPEMKAEVPSAHECVACG
jgi:eukaryotic-like serine/threonine-protein kinase